MSKLVSATVCTCVLFAIGSIRAEPEPFTVDCQLPFESIKKHHLIDDALAPLQPLVASVKPETIKEVTPIDDMMGIVGCGFGTYTRQYE